MTGRGVVLLAAALAGCTGQLGTLSVELVTAPGSTLLDDVVHARLTLTQPYTVVEADRDGGQGLVLEVDATGASGQLLFEGLDAGGARIAVGQTPYLPIAAVDANVRIYVAPPVSLAAAPIALEPARTEIGAGALGYGVLLAGGRGAGGAPLRDLVIYNAYDHQLQVGRDLPAARTGMAVGIGATGWAYLFGGADDRGAPSGTFWRFDTTVAPAGAYLVLDPHPDLARIGAAAAPVGQERFLVTGAPPILIDGVTVSLGAVEAPGPPRLAGTATAVQTSDGAIYTVFAGDGNGASGVIRHGADGFAEVTAPAEALRTGHGAAPTPDGHVVVIGGATADGLVASAVRVDPAAKTAEAIPDVLATPRRDAAVAANGQVLLVAGGTDAAGALVTDAELIDVASLARLGTRPLIVPRTGAVAEALPNGQILVVGGRDADGAPVGVVELFTPDLPQVAAP